ncbi:hypothetical protein [Nostoc sp.]
MGNGEWGVESGEDEGEITNVQYFNNAQYFGLPRLVSARVAQYECPIPIN